MALIHPFRGYRYDPGVVGDLGKVVTQPYDKISPQARREYYLRSPHSVVRVTKSEEKDENPESDYPAAGAAFESWVRQGVLMREAAPAIYAYFQDYEWEGEPLTRKGFIALLDLARAGSGILPHERTMAEPKLDRLRLLRSTECNEDLIFMLYTDDRLKVNRVLDGQCALREPDIAVKDDFGVMHRVWAVSDPGCLREICDAMVMEELFIADGHHRYETSLTFMRECAARGWCPDGIESFDKRMVGCFNSADRGITILPTHRMVRDLSSFSSASFLESAGAYFRVEPAASAGDLWRRLQESRGAGHVFGFYAGDGKRFHSLTLRDEARVDPLMLAHGEAYRHLDVSILHSMVLEKLLGIDEAKLVSQAHVDYGRDPGACLRKVNEGRYQAVFFLNPTTVEQVQRVALLGERMPQKSTDFYPKLLTGLVFMKMNILKPPARED